MLKIALNNHKFPLLLKEIHPPPKQLFYSGNPDLLNSLCISIVGTRKATEYGQLIVDNLIKEMSGYGITIVSGLATGIDTYAHYYALKYGLPTIAVVAGGIDKIYPASNTKLAEKITRNGLIISEYPATTEYKKNHFPQRNRIISGLSVLTVVIEAPEKSGALITARFALEQGRDIAVVPGDIDRENSLGCIRLLQNGGAYPITSARDILDLLKKQPMLPITDINNIPINISPAEKQILQSLSRFRGKNLQTISKSLGIEIQKLLPLISMLEIKEFILVKDNKYLLNT